MNTVEVTVTLSYRGQHHEVSSSKWGVPLSISTVMSAVDNLLPDLVYEMQDKIAD